MNRLLPAVLATLCVAAALAAVPTHAAAQATADTMATAVAPAMPTDAYLDDRARETVRLARVRRTLYDARIRSYSATAVERMTVGLRAGIAERLLYRRETASRIDWTLDTVRVAVLGAREASPTFSGAVRVPADLHRYMPSVAFDPVDSDMMLRLDSTNLRHPLANGSEQHYRFESGDSSSIRLPDGRTIRVHELRIRPRRRDPQLIVGSFWVDAATHAVVQAYFRQSRGYELDTPSDDDDCGIACRVALAALPNVTAELDYIAIDYGLWDLQWWMPRSVAARGVVRAGRFSMPLDFERRYSDYEVVGNPAAAILAAGDSSRARPCRPMMAMMVSIGSSPSDSAKLARRDSVVEERRQAAIARRAESRAAGDSVPDECDRTFIVTRAGVDELLNSELLPPSIYAAESGVFEIPELDAIAAGLRRIPAPFWQLDRPTLRLPSDLRYNRVEGASAAVGAGMDFGRLTADAELGIGTGDRRLRGELGVTRPGSGLHARAAGYTRLASLDETGTPFSLGNSLNALLLGRDEHEYFRATGVELLVRPGAARTPWYDVRLFAERQAAVSKHTDFSVPHLVDDERLFRPNFTADAADQVGGTARLRTSRGVDPRAFRWAAEMELHGETGDFSFVRPALRLQSTLPLGRFALTTQLAGGSSLGDAPAQRDWLLGGAATLRGYPFAAARGVAFWRGRAELGYGGAGARLSLFGDVGYAGDRDELFDARPLRSAGVGLSLLDGLLRLDLARPLDGGKWRVHAHLERMP